MKEMKKKMNEMNSNFNQCVENMNEALCEFIERYQEKYGKEYLNTSHELLADTIFGLAIRGDVAEEEYVEAVRVRDNEIEVLMMPIYEESVELTDEYYEDDNNWESLEYSDVYYVYTLSNIAEFIQEYVEEE